MHLTIILGGTLAGSSTFLLVLFTALKTAADIGLDTIDRRMAMRAADQATTSADSGGP